MQHNQEHKAAVALLDLTRWLCGVTDRAVVMAGLDLLRHCLLHRAGFLALHNQVPPFPLSLRFFIYQIASTR